MTELEAVERDIAAAEENRKLAVQKLDLPNLSMVERATQQASIKAYQQELAGLQGRRERLQKTVG